MTVFGPIPSRRLGESLGVNNIPYKICSYNCVYCQVGRTLRMQSEPSSYGNDPKQIAHEVKKRVERVLETHQKVDYISIVPDGEPTLDLALSEIIVSLKTVGIPVAVITNSSLLWEKPVQEGLKNLERSESSTCIPFLGQNLTGHARVRRHLQWNPVYRNHAC